MAGAAGGLDPHQKEFVKLVGATTRRYRRHEVFRDFCELAALSLSNAVDRAQYEAREARYLAIVKRYEREEVAQFPRMLACVASSLGLGFGDTLGALFMAMELGDHWRGQYFTPYEVALMMARMTVLDDLQERIERRGFVTACEPAAGAGGMVIALANAIHDQGINPQQCLHVVAQDIDETAVHMTYIQLSLLHIPAVVLQGNSLTAEPPTSRWVTAAHVLGGWDRRLRVYHSETSELVPAVDQPLPLLPVQGRRDQESQLTLF